MGVDRSTMEAQQHIEQELQLLHEKINALVEVLAAQQAQQSAQANASATPPLLDLLLNNLQGNNWQEGAEILLDQIETHPVSSTLAALGLGVVIGALLKR